MTGRRGWQAGAAWLAPLAGLAAGAIVLLAVKGCEDPQDPAPLQTAPVTTASSATAPIAIAAAPATASAGPATAASTPSTGRPGLVVHNPCQQPLMLALNFQNAQRQRVTEGFYPIASGTRVALQGPAGPITPHDSLVYFYTETSDSEPVETGRQAQTVGDREVAMKRLNLETPGTAVIELECPGMTSGKP